MKSPSFKWLVHWLSFEVIPSSLQFWCLSIRFFCQFRLITLPRFLLYHEVGSRFPFDLFRDSSYFCCSCQYYPVPILKFS